MKPKKIEHLTLDGAKQLALSLAKYWQSRGYDFRYSIVPFDSFGLLPERTAYVIRSNAVNGTPPRHEAEALAA